MQKTAAINLWFPHFERHVIGLMEKNGLRACRLAIGIIFIWFGMLKPLGLSPADQLVRDVTFWIPIPHFVFLLGLWEVAIGVCFLFQPLTRFGVALLFMHMPGTVLPFFLLPEQCWRVFPHALTLEGQYIVKNLVLVAAALVVGGKVRRHRDDVQRLAPFTGEGFLSLLNHGTWIDIAPGTTLIRQGEHHDYLYYLAAGRGSVEIDGRPVAELSAGQLIGEMSYLTRQGAGATVKAAEAMRLVRWSKLHLAKLQREQPDLLEALQAAICQDLVCKLQQRPVIAEAGSQPPRNRRGAAA
ncbi:Crp/Fnr family transcriptional regulator [Acanthopleuribacter pedis]|uniref:Cyclic nucleotide-binding domain-containing protein n=1 Tax=Acanthopleuribacter pedis TaxID=442870 RepID=A0A8J7U4B2_9BACT|nr:cyclic nucleotide-binding domain-containing protein [Acanthopleuribacter pedis]MBO1320462.1 cyclic nucleotide-binding domain-containing protein [Acanthopleuribacter pedis]